MLCDDDVRDDLKRGVEDSLVDQDVDNVLKVQAYVLLCQYEAWKFGDFYDQIWHAVKAAEEYEKASPLVAVASDDEKHQAWQWLRCNLFALVR